MCHDAAASHPVETGATSSIHAVGKLTLVNSPFLVALPDFLLYKTQTAKQESEHVQWSRAYGEEGIKMNDSTQ